MAIDGINKREKLLKTKSFVGLPSLCCFIICTGSMLACYQFIFNRSLWMDEAMLALNIIRKDFTELGRPLSYGQVAPIGFLYVERLATILFGKNELALRVFPLASFLASIPLFYLFSKKLSRNNSIALISTSIFSVNLSLLYYSSEVKQYSIDVMVTIVILYCLFAIDLEDHKASFLYAAVGSIAIWFSNIAVIILFVVGIYLLYFEGYEKKNFKVLLTLMLWLLSFSIYYYLFVHNHPLTESMKLYWERYFLPLNPFSFDFYNFLGIAVKDLYANLMGFGPFWYFPLLISLCGILFIFYSRNYKVLYFCLTPIIVNLILSGLELYPFHPRLILYNIPLIIIIYSGGIYHLYKFSSENIFRLPKIVLALPLIIMFYPIYLHFPLENEEIKKSLIYIESNIKNGEDVYVYYGSRSAFEFYKEAKIINLSNQIIFGSKHRNNMYKYHYELTALKGNTWLLFSHFFQPGGSSESEEKYMIRFLQSKGAEVLDSKEYRGSRVYYVDTKGIDSM